MSREKVVICEGVSAERGGVGVLRDVSFAVEAGDFVGIVGPNGAGKTTLLKALLGLVPITSGRIEVLGHDPRSHGGSSFGIGYVPQRHAIDPRFPASVRDVVEMGCLPVRRGWQLLAGRRRPSADERQRAESHLERVGIADLADRPIGRLSGGQQRRVMLAQALCASRRLLVLDEPTIGLDLPAEQEFYALLRELKQDLLLTVVAVSHDLVALAGACDALICINQHMHIHGNPEDVIHSHAIEEAYRCEFSFLAGEIAHHEHRGTTPASSEGE